MVFKKSFKLLVATGTTPIFAVVSIIFAQDCSSSTLCFCASFALQMPPEGFLPPPILQPVKLASVYTVISTGGLCILSLLWWMFFIH